VKPELPQPDFAIGDLVEVRVGGNNQTPHVGTVRDVVWHFKDNRYNYYLIEDGKNISKRYLAEDLARVPAG
jgi:hypothetical protein